MRGRRAAVLIAIVVSLGACAGTGAPEAPPSEPWTAIQVDVTASRDAIVGLVTAGTPVAEVDETVRAVAGALFPGSATYATRSLSRIDATGFDAVERPLVASSVFVADVVDPGVAPSLDLDVGKVAAVLAAPPRRLTVCSRSVPATVTAGSGVSVFSTDGCWVVDGRGRDIGDVTVGFRPDAWRLPAGVAGFAVAFACGVAALVSGRRRTRWFAGVSLALAASTAVLAGDAGAAASFAGGFGGEAVTSPVWGLARLTGAGGAVAALAALVVAARSSTSLPTTP